MKRYLMRNAEGLYLNTDYHTRYARGEWRNRDDARIYKSLQGLRSAFNSIPPSIRKLVGEVAKPTVDSSTEDRRRYWDLLRERSEAIRAIPTAKFFSLIEEDGYVVEEVEL